MNSVDTVGVVGLGTMGAGIAEVFLRAGLDVVAVEIAETPLSAGRNRLEQSLQRAVDRGRLDADARDEMLGRSRFTTDRGRLAEAGLVVEAVPERLELKTELFADLDGVCPDETVFVTNTSSLPVTQLAAATQRPGRLVGMHFFNPAPVMKLVEVVGTVLSDDDVVSGVADLATQCGKTPVIVDDRAGFVANALLLPYLNDAARALETGRAGAAQLDAAVVEVTGFPMGPLTLADLIGLDVCLDVLEVLWEEFRTARTTATPLLRRLVMAGRLGRKTGEGFYSYAGDRPEPAVVREVRESSYDVSGLVARHLADAVRMVDDGYATKDQVDTAMRLGCGYPKGPFALLDDLPPDVRASAVALAAAAAGE